MYSIAIAQDVKGYGQSQSYSCYLCCLTFSTGGQTKRTEEEDEAEWDQDVGEQKHKKLNSEREKGREQREEESLGVE